jgi:predicted RNase H-like HicB family nuclease
LLRWPISTVGGRFLDMANQSVHAVIYKDPYSDQWVAACLEYRLTTQGDSAEHALEMIQEAVELHLEDMSKEDIERIYVPVGSEPIVRKFDIRAPTLLQ